MKKILITSASGPLATGMVRAIRALEEPYEIIGVDTNPLHFHGIDAEKKFLIPRIAEPAFLPVIRQIIDEVKPDLFFPLHDDEMPIFAAMENLGVKTFLPTPEFFKLTQDKLASFDHFIKHGVPVPDTILINDEDDLKRAISRFDGETWLRAVRGAGGKGAFRAQSYDDAVAWLNLNRGWGTFTAAEVLKGDDCVVETVWYEGELIVAQSRRRPTGNSGEVSPARSSRGVLLSGAPQVAIDVAMQAIKSASDRPHGILFVDQIVDSSNVAKVTEINPGRFTTGGFHAWTEFGYNAMGTVLDLCFGNEIGFETPLIDPIPADTYKLSGYDYPTFYLPASEVEGPLAELAGRVRKAS